MSERSPFVLTTEIRKLTHQILHPMGMTLARWKIHPDSLTLLGLILVMVACVFVARGAFGIALVILCISLPLDALDGAVARAMQRRDQFGAVLDSSLDRYADGFIFMALSYYLALQQQSELMLLALLALLGSQLVSYVRARAEGIGLDVKIGLFSRLERLLVIMVILALPSLMGWGLGLLAIGTNFTALQRLWFVYKTLHTKGD